MEDWKLEPARDLGLGRLERARSLRRGTYLACLTWFNVEVWGRVIWTIIHW